MTDDTITIARSEYDRLLAEIEDLRDTLELAQAEHADDGTRVPGTVVEHLVKGEHPVAAWRKYRGLSAPALADAAGVAADDVAAIEAREWDGSVAALRTLANALDAPVALLIEDN